MTTGTDQARPLSRDSDDLTRIATDAEALAGELGRSELIPRVHQSLTALDELEARVVVVGEFKQGKSALVNAVVNAPVCPVDAVSNTAVPTVIHHGDSAAAELVFDARTDVVGQTTSTPVDIAALGKHVVDAAGKDGRLLRAEVSLPREILAEGLVIVDTPGVGRNGAAHAASTLAMLPGADAVLMLSDASQEYTRPELAFLQQAAALCPEVVCVLSKTDVSPHWRDIAEADRHHLDQAGITAPLLPVSSALRGHAVAAKDKKLNAESGFPTLLRHVRTEVIGRAAARARRAVANEILAVSENMALAINAELETLRHPGRAPGLQSDLKTARDAAAALKERAARWQQTLNDGVNDLSSDIDHDLRDRLRKVTREAENLIDDADPGEIWDEFGLWLGDAVAQAVGDNFVWTHQRSVYLAEIVAEHFSADGDIRLPEFRLASTAEALQPVTALEAVDTGRLRLTQKLQIGMRGSYGGILMFGLITGLAGMALVNPISVAAGLLMGGSAYRQDHKSRLDRRRAVAKGAVRRLIDEAIFQIGKESRDRLREIKIVLRDHFTTIAEEVQASLQSSIDSAKAGEQTSASRRPERITELTAQLDRCDAIARRAKLAVVAHTLKTVSAPAEAQSAPPAREGGAA